MYTLFVTLTNDNTYPIDFYSLDVARECGLDHLRAPDVRCAEVKEKATSKTIWVGVHRGKA